MPTALLIIDVQQALCSGEHTTFDAAGTIARINQVSAQALAAEALVVLSAAQISAHHNATLANISSFGPRVTLTPAADVMF